MPGPVDCTGPGYYMVGWYVDLGVVDQSQLPLTNISDISIYDYNRPFSIGTNWPEISLEGSAGVETYANMGAELFNILGNEYSTIYAAPNNALENIDAINMIPSLKYAYPNYIAAKIPPSTNTYRAYIFRNLKRVVLQQHWNNFSTSVYRIDDGGSLTRLGAGTASQDGPPYYGTRASNRPIIFYWFIRNYTKGISLLDDSIEYGYLVSGSGFANSYTLQTETVTRPTWFTLLFTPDDPAQGPVSPDFDEDGKQNDPFDPVDPSEPGTNPPGTFDDESDPIPDSPLPSISAADTGFTRIYNPSLSQVQALARYLWTEPSVIDTIWNHIKQFFEDPMQAIIGFNLVPCRIQNGPTTSFKLMFIDTGVEMTTAANQFVDVDCGILQVEPYYGSALDYSPYTKTSLFLPYVGMVSLDTDEIMGNELAVKYRIDICSGSCVAKVFIDGNCMYQFSGHCAISIPINSADFSGYVQAAISVAKLGIAYAAGSAMTAAAALSPSPKQTTSNTSTISITKTERNPATGRQVTMGTQTQTVTNEGAVYKSSFDSISPANISNTVGNIMGSKAHVEHAGSFSGNTGYLGVRRPYLLIERPNMCRPASWASMNGYPAMITMKLGDCKGFTKVQQVYLCGTRATQAEDDEILSFLKSGVIL